MDRRPRLCNRKAPTTQTRHEFKSTSTIRADTNESGAPGWQLLAKQPSPRRLSRPVQIVEAAVESFELVAPGGWIVEVQATDVEYPDCVRTDSFVVVAFALVKIVTELAAWTEMQPVFFWAGALISVAEYRRAHDTEVVSYQLEPAGGGA
jgi:hypothetical protein